MERDLRSVLAGATDEPDPAFVDRLRGHLTAMDPDPTNATDSAVDVPVATGAPPMAPARRWRPLVLVAVAAALVALLGETAAIRSRPEPSPPAAPVTSERPATTSPPTSTASTLPTVAATVTTATVPTSTVTVTTATGATAAVPADSTTPTPLVSETPAGPFQAIAGDYVGSTGSSGDAVIQPDGTAVFTGPDFVTCQTCSTATAPRASLEMALTELVQNADGGYTASGTVSGSSNADWAATVLAGATESVVGRPVSLRFSPNYSGSVCFPEPCVPPVAAAVLFDFLPENDWLAQR